MRRAILIALLFPLALYAGCAARLPGKTPAPTQAPYASIRVVAGGEHVSERTIAIEDAEACALIDRIVLDALVKSAAWPGTDPAELTDYIALTQEASADAERQTYYHYQIEGRPVLQMGDMGMYTSMGQQAHADLLLLAGLEPETQDTAAQHAEYRRMEAAEARKLLDGDAAAVLLDVRSAEEYKQRRIPGAMLIPDSELAARAETELPDKDALILVYCRSGRRSEASARLLVSLGYTNVWDIGGINDWPYETEAG